MTDLDGARRLQCCICGQAGEWAEMFGMTLFPALDVEPFQLGFRRNIDFAQLIKQYASPR
jgi:hypothetical protein